MEGKEDGVHEGRDAEKKAKCDGSGEEAKDWGRKSDKKTEKREIEDEARQETVL